MNVISAIFALLGITSFIIDLNLNGLYRSEFDYYNYLVMVSEGPNPTSTQHSLVWDACCWTVLGSPKLTCKTTDELMERRKDLLGGRDLERANLWHRTRVCYC